MSNIFVDFHNEQNKCLDTLYAAQQQMSKIYMTGRGMWLELRATINSLQQKNAELCKMVDVLRERVQKPTSTGKQVLCDEERDILNFFTEYKDIKIHLSAFGYAGVECGEYYTLVGYTWIGLRENPQYTLVFVIPSNYAPHKVVDNICRLVDLKSDETLCIMREFDVLNSDYVVVRTMTLHAVKNLLSCVKFTRV